MPLPAAPPRLPPSITATAVAGAEPPQRLAVITATYAQYADWCHAHGLSVHERRLLHLTHGNAWVLRGLREIRYIVLDWPPHTTPDGQARLLAALHARGATPVTADELAAWEAAITDRTPE